MIEQALREHLLAQSELTYFLGLWADTPAIFNQEAPADNDERWEQSQQYSRIVFAVDIQGDPERAMGGILTVDIMCKKDEQFPEEIEPVARQLIHGYFFSNGKFTVSAQWRDSSYFTQSNDEVTGCTITFDLLAFPIITTSAPDIVARFNDWTALSSEYLYVINRDELPAAAWKPTGSESAVYWRLVTDNPAKWIPDTFQTVWRTATVKCHIFSEDNAIAANVARDITTKLYADKRILKSGETPIMVNRQNSTDLGADPLRTGQVTVEATYAIVVYRGTNNVFQKLNVNAKKGDPDMANDSTKTKSANVAEKSSEKVNKPTQESVYTAEELADNHKLFGTFREVVVVALRLAGKETATISEAKNIIENFQNKEVK